MKPKHQKKQPYKNASSSIALTIKLNKYASVWSKLCVLLLKRESGEALRAFFHWLDRSIALNLQKAPRTAHLNSHKHTARSFQNCTDSGRSKIAPLWLIQRDFFILTQSCPFSKSGSEPTLNRNVFTRRIYFTLFYISFFLYFILLWRFFWRWRLFLAWRGGCFHIWKNQCLVRLTESINFLHVQRTHVLTCLFFLQDNSFDCIWNFMYFSMVFFWKKLLYDVISGEKAISLLVHFRFRFRRWKLSLSVLSKYDSVVYGIGKERFLPHRFLNIKKNIIRFSFTQKGRIIRAQ